jgi:hypothetical protein
VQHHRVVTRSHTRDLFHGPDMQHEKENTRQEVQNNVATHFGHSRAHEGYDQVEHQNHDENLNDTAYNRDHRVCVLGPDVTHNGMKDQFGRSEGTTQQGLVIPEIEHVSGLSCSVDLSLSRIPCRSVTSTS